MKQRLLELRSLVEGSDLPITDVYRPILIYESIYTCFRLSIGEEIDVEEYKKHAKRATLLYLSLNIVNYENNFSFVKGFYESYILYEIEDVLSSVSNQKSPIYDDTLASLMGRMYAIIETYQKGILKEIFDELEETLQNP